MVRVLFVCHGNICRSTMAQFIFQDMINKKGLQDLFEIDSAATSREEIGCGPHYGTVQKLKQVGIPVLTHKARQMTYQDYKYYDYIIGMDANNMRNMLYITKNNKDKLSLLLDYSNHPRNISDPWWTGDFESTYNDVIEGLEGFYAYLEEHEL